MFRKYLILIFLFVLSSEIQAIRVNGYARVTSIAGTTINLSNVNESDDSFEVGEEIIIYQTQNDVIGSNTGDNASFGDLSNIQSAGLYEILEIASVTESGGVPTSITVVVAPNNTYNTGSNSRVQLVTFPELGTPNYTTADNINPRSWNGSRGGVLAFQVQGILTLVHNITADGRGFRGGAVNSDGSSAGCSGEQITV